MNDRVRRADSFLRAWSKHEHAPRIVCRECQFESSEGYPPSHSAGCSLQQVERCAVCGGLNPGDATHTRC